LCPPRKHNGVWIVAGNNSNTGKIPMKRFRVSWGTLTTDVTAANSSDAWAVFNDIHRAKCPGLEKFPKRHARTVKELPPTPAARIPTRLVESVALKHKRFREIASTRGRVDREAGIIYGVQLLGKKSKNGREYSEEAMQKAVGLYDGKKCYMGHPESSKMGEDRPFSSWLGVIENSRYESGAIFGDIKLRKTSPHFEEVLEAASDFASNFGCSHVADGTSRLDRGTEVIEEITEVFSVDIVTEPATASGLFESTQIDRRQFASFQPQQPAASDVEKFIKRYSR
jgi:hypothetical protein